MATTVARKREVVEGYRRKEGDTGSPEVQVALLTERVQYLTEHLKGHPKDHLSRVGLIKLVSRRTKLLKYLARADRAKYREIIERLGLRK